MKKHFEIRIFEGIVKYPKCKKLKLAIFTDFLKKIYISKIFGKLLTSQKRVSRYLEIQLTFWIQVASFCSLRSCVNRLSKEPAFVLLFRLWQLRGRSALHQQMRFARCRIRSIPADDRWVETQWEIILSRNLHKTDKKKENTNLGLFRF